MYRTARRVTGYLARQLRDLRTIGVISSVIYNKAMRNVSYAKKVIKSNQKALSKAPSRRQKVRKGQYQALKKKVGELSKFMEQEQAIHIHRQRNTSRVTSSVNSITFAAYAEGGSIAHLEAAMASLRYFDPGTNALVTAAPTTGTYHRDIIASVTNKILIRNNYQVPCKLRLYACRPKDDTSISATTAFSNGLTDQGNPSATSPLVFLTDSSQFNELWKIDQSKMVVLQPGQECIHSYHIKEFDYDFALGDSHSLSYQSKYNGFNYVIRLEGILGHDTAIDEQGTLQAAVDVQIDSTYKFRYDAGKDLEDYSVTDNSDTFTNAGVVSNKPVSDNQQYSVA